MELKGAKALITGGSEGIGKGIARVLIAEGCDVVITGRTQKTLEAAAKELGCGFHRGDVGNEQDAVETVERFVADHGRLDILINNAGWGYFAPLVDMDLARMKELYDTNVFGAFLMGREAAKQFVKQDGGHLVNISSTAGTMGGKGGTAYSSSKFALKGMTECWRAELRPHNVRVILVNPSEVLTPFSSKAGYSQEPNPKKLRPEEIAAAVVGALKMDDRGFLPEFSVFATNPF